MAYTYQDIGARIRQRDPEAFKGITATDEEIGRRAVERKPELRSLIQVQEPAPQPQEKGFFRSIGEALVEPFAKAGVSAVRATQGVYGLGKAAVQGAMGDTEAAKQTIFNTGAAVQRPVDLPFVGKTQAVQNLSQGIGTGLEIGATLAPAGRGLSTAARSGLFAAGSGASEVGRQMAAGEDVNPGKILVSSAVGGALPLAGKLVSKAASKGAQLGGKVAGSILGKSTGAGFEPLKQAFENPNVIQYARQASKEGPEQLLNEAFDQSKQALRLIRDERRNAYLGQLDKIKADPADVIDALNVTRQKSSSLLKERGISIEPNSTGVGPLNKFNFEKSTIVGNEPLVQRALNDIYSWTDTTASGLDTLKKRLGDFIDGIPESKGPAKTILLEIRDNLDTELKDKVPGYLDMTKGYREASQLIDELEKGLSLGDKAQRDTAVRKLMSTMRLNNELRNEMVGVLEKRSGSDILTKVAGATLSELSPRGLSGAITGAFAGAGGVAAWMNPALLPSILFTAAVTSPRVAAEAANIAGRVTSQMLKANKYTPEIQNAIRILLQKIVTKEDGGTKEIKVKRPLEKKVSQKINIKKINS